MVCVCVCVSCTNQIVINSAVAFLSFLSVHSLTNEEQVEPPAVYAL